MIIVFRVKYEYMKKYMSYKQNLIWEGYMNDYFCIIINFNYALSLINDNYINII